jgi:hypothetical protein
VCTSWANSHSPISFYLCSVSFEKTPGMIATEDLISLQQSNFNAFHPLLNKPSNVRKSKDQPPASQVHRCMVTTKLDQSCVRASVWSFFTANIGTER